MITALVSTVPSNKAPKPSFGCREDFAAAIKNSELPRKLNRIFKDLEIVIQEKWAKFRKSKNFVPGMYPEFPVQRFGNDKIVTLSLKNNGKERYVLDVTKGAETERLNIDRENPRKFLYERIFKTEKGGSYTSKTYNSEREKDEEMISKVYEMYEKYMPFFSGTKEKAMKTANKNVSHFNKADLI